MTTSKGKVYLVGAGPGDPGLITVKGQECIALADVVIYDYLASPSLLKYARRDAELIYVGKKGGDHTLPQDGI
ncbi:MAG: SAM-dependent methyltransferase, partial [Desulfobacterales bacterium]|nr:SAM-dependent methyltransferase [Desulfobacterales bacterium]